MCLNVIVALSPLLSLPLFLITLYIFFEIRQKNIEEKTFKSVQCTFSL